MKLRFALSLGIIIFVVDPSWAETKETTSIYLKPELTRESNIFEHNTNSTDAYGQILWGGINYIKRDNANLLTIDLTGNYSSYFENSEENKFITTAHYQATQYYSSRFFFCSESNLYLKWWQNTLNGYINWDIDGRLGYRNPKMNVQTGVYYRIDNYRYYDWLDARYYGLFNDLNYITGTHSNFVARINYTFIKYPLSNEISNPVYNNIDNIIHQNHTFSLQIGGEYRKQLIAGLFIKFLYVDSNYYFGSYFSASLQFYATYELLSTFLQIIAQLQLKQYVDDPSDELIYYNPDPEKNIQNQLFIGWEKPLIGNLSLTGKVVLMRNETRFIGLYYSKWLITCGLQYRFNS
jgi:hypothetical protein